MQTAKKKLSFWPQVALIFFIVSGGAYGLEPLVRQVGVKWTLLLILLMPLIWAIPTAAMVAELSAALPEAGGYYTWVRRGLGRFWGFQEGWWTLCYSAVDLAVYPVLFVTYLAYFFPLLNSEEPTIQLIRWGICGLFVLVSLIFNLRGIHLIGLNAIFSLFVVTLPFVLLTGIGLLTGDWQNLITAIWQPPTNPINFTNLAAGFAIILWNYCGWDNVSTYAHEVSHPERNYPRSLLAAMLIIILSYFLPMLAGLSITTDPELWSQGWPTIANQMSGPIFGTLITVAALLSAWALFNTQLLYISRLPMAMAKDSLLPKFLEKRSKLNGTPYMALIIMALFAILFSRLSFSKLMVVDILFYTLGISLEFLTLIILRQKEPLLTRPYKIPLNRLGLALMALLPLSLAIAIAIFSTLGPDGSLNQVTLVLSGIATGLLIYFLFYQDKVKMSHNPIADRRR